MYIYKTIYTNGEFTKAMDQLIIEMQIDTPEDLAVIMLGDNLFPLLAVLEDRLGRTITEEAPMSEREESLRYGFYLVSFGNRLGENAANKGIPPVLYYSFEEWIAFVGMFTTLRSMPEEQSPAN